jgi:hypothetical protein
VNPFCANFDPQYFSSHALGLSDMLTRLVDRDAIGGVENWSDQEDQSRD